MSSLLARHRADPAGAGAWVAVAAAALLLGGCATASSMRSGQAAERFQDYDRAVVEYTKAVRAKPDDRAARLALDRARLRASQAHYFRGQVSAP